MLPRLRECRRGVTLLELLVAIVVAAILAAAAIPVYTRMVDRSRAREAETLLNMIRQAERMFRLDTGNFGTINDLIGQRYLPGPIDTPRWRFRILARNDPDGSTTITTAEAARLDAAGNETGQCIKVILLTGDICQNGFEAPAVPFPECSQACGTAE